MADAAHIERAPARLSDFLREHIDQILDEWALEVRKSRASRTLDRLALIDHLPEFLHDLARHVAEVRAGRESHPDASLPRIHAVERLESGYDLKEVVEEYGVLRQVIVSLFVSTGADAVRSAEMPRLHEAIDLAISTAVERYLMARDRTLIALDRLTTASLGNEGVEQFLIDALDILHDTTPAVDSSQVLLAEGPVLRVRAARGDAARMGLDLVVKIGEGFAGRVAAEGRPIFVSDSSAVVEGAGQSTPRSGTLALYGVPMFVGETLLGVALMGSKTTREFSNEDKLIFRATVNRAAALVFQGELRKRERQVARRLEASEDRLRLALDAAAIGTWDLRPDGELLWDEGCNQIFGLPSGSEVTLETALGLIHPDDRGKVEAAMARTMDPALRARFDIEYRILPADGQPQRWVSARGRAVFERDETQRFVGTNIDVTERKLQQEELARAIDFRDELLAVLGHDLRNPLHAITLSADLLLRRANLGGATTSVVRIKQAADRIKDVITDLLDFARTRFRGGLPVARKAVDLAEVAREVVEELAVANPDRELATAVSGDATGFWDQSRLAQMLSNLVGNAVQYGSAQDPVRIAIEGLEADVLVSVHNRGNPIPADVMPSLFEPFRRGRSAKQSAGNNLGLGLYIAQEIASAHGARLEVESTEEDGTTFRVRLPRGAAPDQSAGALDGLK